MYINWMDTCIKSRVLTPCCCAGSGEEGFMEDVKKGIKWMDKCIKTKVLTICCCAGIGEEGVMEDVKGDMDHMHKKKSTYCLFLGR